MDSDTILKYLQDSIGPEPDLSLRAASQTLRPPGFGAGHGQPGDRTGLSGFEAVELIGKGGMGEVLSARQRSLDRLVALKRLLPPQRQRPGAASLFLSEALINGRLEHPNIVPVHDLGTTPDGELFLAMKLVEGRSWQDALGNEPATDLVYHLDILKQVCNAVAFAHSRGVVHNDLKPANVMLGAFGEVLVMDWGLAVEVGAEAPSRFRHRSAIDRLCGTPAYAAPELLTGRGSEVGPWTDIYLLGGLLHAVLTGRPPHQGRDLLAMVHSALQGQVRSFDASVPAELQALCCRALALDPKGRQTSVEDFKAELEAFLQHRASRALGARSKKCLQDCQGLRTQASSGEAARTRLYGGFAEAVAGFGQALALWPENREAIEGLQQARSHYAEAALALGDLGLAEAQLPELAGAEVASSLRLGIARERSRRRAEATARSRLKWGSVAALLAALLGLGSGLFLVSAKNRQIEATNRDLLREQQLVRAQNLEIAAQNAEILAEQQRVERQRGYARRRGDIASAALEALASQVQEELVQGLGDERAHLVASRILQVALDGWEQLREAALEQETVSRGAAQAQLQVGILLLQVQGDAAGALRQLQGAESVLVTLDVEDPEVAFDLARLRVSLGDAWRTLGRLPEARTAYNAGLELAAREPAARASSAAGRLHGLCLASLADVVALQGDLPAAVAAYTEAIALIEQTGPRGEPATDFSLAVCLEDAGGLHHSLGQTEQALACYRRAVSLLARQKSDSVRFLRAQAATLGGLSQVLGETGGLQEARGLAEQAVALARRLFGLDPASLTARDALAASLSGLAAIVEQQGESGAARHLMEEALGLRRAMLRADPRSLAQVEDLGRELAQLSVWLARHGARVEADSLLADAIGSYRLLCEADSTNLAYRRLLGSLLQERAQRWIDVQGWAAAEASIRASLALHQELVASDASDMRSQRSLCAALHGASRLELAQGHLGASRERLEQFLARQRDLLSREPGQLENERGLALALLQSAPLLIELGALDAAEKAAAEALGRVEGLLARDASDFSLLEDLGKALLTAAQVASQRELWQAALARFEEARQVLLECLHVAGEKSATLLDLSLAYFGTGSVYCQLEQLQEAGPASAASLELLGRILDRDPKSVEARQLEVQVLGLEGTIAAARGEPFAAESWFRRQLEAARPLAVGIPGGQDLRNLWSALHNLSEQLEAMGDPEGALPLAVEALSLARLHVARDTTNLLVARELMMSIKITNLLQLETESLEAAAASGAELLERGAQLCAQLQEDTLLEAHRIACLVQVALVHEARGEIASALALTEQAASRARTLLRRAPGYGEALAPILELPESYRFTAALGEGELVAVDEDDFSDLAELRFYQGRWAEAVAAYESALAGGVISDPDLVLRAARAAARALALAGPSEAEPLRRRSLAWLRIFLEYKDHEQSVIGSRPEAQGDTWTAVRLRRIPADRERARQHPDLEVLRGEPAFQALFEEPAVQPDADP